MGLPQQSPSETLKVTVVCINHGLLDSHKWLYTQLNRLCLRWDIQVFSIMFVAKFTSAQFSMLALHIANHNLTRTVHGLLLTEL